MHAGRQDIPLVKRMWGVQPRNLFDTQIAAAFVGASVQPSYEALLGQFLRTPVSKSATFTRWDRRPLTDEQLSYARADVEHLLPLAASLRERLEQRGPAGVGAGGVPPAGGGERRARPRRGLPAAAAGSPTSRRRRLRWRSS